MSTLVKNGTIVTASDKYGRSGEFKPFEVQASQLTIVD